MKAKNIWLLTAGVWGLLLGAAPAQAQVSFGHAEKCCEEWLFRLGDDSAALHPAYDDSRWTRVRLPHDWSVKQPLSPSLASCTGYLPGGIGWYRRHFTVDDSAARHYIYFEGIYNRSRVYLNGHLLGTPAGTPARASTATPGSSQRPKSTSHRGARPTAAKS